MPRLTDYNVEKMIGGVSMDGQQTCEMILIKNAAMDYARVLLEFLPESREKSLALTKLQETVFWATSSIAQQFTPEDGSEFWEKEDD